MTSVHPRVHLAPRARRFAAAPGAATLTGEAAVAAAWQALGTVPDPEVPAVSIVELGIVRAVEAGPDGVSVTLTPTYSGCPATELIEAAAHEALDDAGVIGARIGYRLAPAWTTAWLAPEAREKLRAFGIAPPGAPAGGAPPGAPVRIDVSRIAALRRVPVPCPRCRSARTALLSQFGSTACKAQYRCLDCREPFDYFKPH